MATRACATKPFALAVFPFQTEVDAPLGGHQRQPERLPVGVQDVRLIAGTAGETAELAVEP